MSDRPNARGRAQSDSGHLLFTSGQFENVELIALARVCWFLHLLYFCTSSASNTQRTAFLGTREFIGSRRSPSICQDFTKSIQHLQSHAGCGRIRRLPSTTHRMRHFLLVSRTLIGNNTQSSKFIFSHWLFFALFLLIDDPDAVSAFFCLVPHLATPPTLSKRPPSHSPLPEFQLGVCWPVLPSAFHHLPSENQLPPSLFVPFARAFHSATSRSCSITPQLLHPPIPPHSVHFRPRGQPQSTVS